MKKIYFRPIFLHLTRCNTKLVQVCLDGELGVGRKRSYSMTEEDDLTNVPSLQMRISILQQRVTQYCLVAAGSAQTVSFGNFLFCLK